MLAMTRAGSLMRCCRCRAYMTSDDDNTNENPTYLYLMSAIAEFLRGACSGKDDDTFEGYHRSCGNHD